MISKGCLRRVYIQAYTYWAVVIFQWILINYALIIKWKRSEYHVSTIYCVVWWTSNCICTVNVISCCHYNDVIMSAMASQISSLTIVYSTVYSGVDHRKKSKLHVTSLCEGNSPVTSEFPAQKASNAECFHLMTSSCVMFALWQCITVCNDNVP